MAEPYTLDFPETLPAERRDQHWWVESDGVEVRLSNLDKVLWPESGHTKGDLLAYYWNAATFILPHLAGRPLTLKRMPDGIGGSHFYQKDAPDYTPEWMPRCAIEPEDGKIDEMLMVDRPAHLLFVVNLGAIELHPLHSGCESYDCPDYLVFDLDPFQPAGFEETLAVAHHVGAALDALGLNGYPKTSGATGIQVYVPVAPDHTFAETRQLAERIGLMIERADPERVTMEWSVSERAGRVFIDHNMNRRAASLAAAYSVRPLPDAPVSTPLDWDEIEEASVRPNLFRIDNVMERLAERGDIFAPVVERHQRLDAALERLEIERAPDDISEGRVRQVIKPARS
ncbi:MAG TPA: non-homologous end-joining DNA ligase [Acidimicrobiia bacterium]|nr:non-homologous end-joining DNA ligase [Acidimicrobiia bacterium]